jgi:DNA-binding response OmpR family regulator
MNNSGAFIKDAAGQHVAVSYDPANGRPIPKVFVVCDQKDTAPVWGYILRQQGLRVFLETSLEKAIEHWSSEITDLIVLDLAVAHPRRMEFYKEFRTLSVIPVIMMLPTYHETEMLEAYAAGVDDVVIKPISPPIFLAKILSWVRRSWVVPVDSLNLINAANYRLEPTRRSLTHPDGQEVKLTNLEFRLLHLLMSRPGHNFNAEEIIQFIWGGYGDGDQVLLKNVVYRLRKKIEDDPSHPTLLRTWPGGYSFQNQ